MAECVQLYKMKNVLSGVKREAAKMFCSKCGGGGWYAEQLTVAPHDEFFGAPTLS